MPSPADYATAARIAATHGVQVRPAANAPVATAAARDDVYLVDVTSITGDPIGFCANCNHEIAEIPDLLFVQLPPIGMQARVTGDGYDPVYAEWAHLPGAPEGCRYAFPLWCVHDGCDRMATDTGDGLCERDAHMGCTCCTDLTPYEL